MHGDKIRITLSEEIDQMVADKFRPLLTEPQLYKTLLSTLGGLNDQELTQLLEKLLPASKKAVAQELTQDIHRFLLLLKDKDVDTLIQEFLLPQEKQFEIEACQIINLEDVGQLIEEKLNPKMQQVIDGIFSVYGELSQIHHVYTGIKNELGKSRGSSHGGEGEMTKAKLTSHLEVKGSTATTFQWEIPNNEFFRAMKEMLVGKYIVQGNKYSSPLASIENHDSITHLERVKSHIIKPLKWSCRRTKAGQAIASAMQSFKAKVADKYGKKEEEEAQETTFITAKDRDQRYETDTKEIGDMINRLQRFTLADVKVEDCKVDAIKDVLDHIENEASSIQSVI